MIRKLERLSNNAVNIVSESLASHEAVCSINNTVGLRKFEKMSLADYCNDRFGNIKKNLAKTEFFNNLPAKEKKVFINTIKKAMEFAANCHVKVDIKNQEIVPQMRDSGEFYISHPFEVANYLTETLDKRRTVYPILDQRSLITAAILHDTLEDGVSCFSSEPVVLKDVKKVFGEKVAEIVEGLTKERKVSKNETEEQRNQRLYRDLKKLFTAASKYPEIIIVKLADSWHNLSTLEYMEGDKERYFKNAADAFVYALIGDFIAVSGDNSFRGNTEKIAKVFEENTRNKSVEKFKKLFDDELITAPIHDKLVRDRKMSKGEILKEFMTYLSQKESMGDIIKMLKAVKIGAQGKNLEADNIDECHHDVKDLSKLLICCRQQKV